MNVEFEKRIIALNMLSSRQVAIATEGLMMFKASEGLLSKFGNLLGDIGSFITDNVIKGFLPNITSTGSKEDKDLIDIKKKLDEYDYLSLRLVDFRIPQGLGIKYLKYVDWLIETATNCQKYIDTNGNALLGTVVDITNNPDKWVGNVKLPKFEEYHKEFFNKGVRDAFTKKGQGKTRWVNLVSRNSDFIVVLDRVQKLNQLNLVYNYNDYVSYVKDMIDRIDKFVKEVTKKDTSISLSPESIRVLSNAILSMAKAVEVFGMTSAFINDFNVVINDNKKQILNMR